MDLEKFARVFGLEYLLQPRELLPLPYFPNGIGYALCLVTWLMLLLYWCGSFFYSLKGLQLLLYPFAALSMLAAAQWPAPGADYAVDNMPFALHVGASVLSYSLFGIATLLALLVLLLNRCLRNHRISPLISFLPPLLSLEKLMFQSMLAGFVLLSISVGGALLFPLEIFGKPLALTHKSVKGGAKVFKSIAYLSGKGLCLRS